MTRRCVGEIGTAPLRDDDRHQNLAFGEPAGMQRLERGEMGAAAAIELSALDGEVDVAAGLVAGDHLDPGREQLVEHRRVELHLRARADASDGKLLRQHVAPGLHR
jgi:hypothetical protein